MTDTSTIISEIQRTKAQEAELDRTVNEVIAAVIAKSPIETRNRLAQRGRRR